MYQDEVVERKGWLTTDEFHEIFTIIQVLPGPNLVNLCVYLGYRLVGPLHAFFSLLALATPGAIIAVFIVAIVNFGNFHVAQIFQGLSLGSVGLFAIFVWRLRHGIISDQVPLRKNILRTLIILAVMATVFAQVRLDLVLLAAVPVCIAVEFLA